LRTLGTGRRAEVQASLNSGRLCSWLGASDNIKVEDSETTALPFWVVQMNTDQHQSKEPISQRNQASEAFAILGSREKQLLRRFAQGMTDRQIAVKIGGTERQVSAQREHLLQKLHIQTAAQRVSVAARLASWPAQPRLLNKRR
jgi:DNA-binding CsgD family transcriptional regulator